MNCHGWPSCQQKGQSRLGMSMSLGRVIARSSDNILVKYRSIHIIINIESEWRKCVILQPFTTTKRISLWSEWSYALHIRLICTVMCPGQGKKTPPRHLEEKNRETALASPRRPRPAIPTMVVGAPPPACLLGCLAPPLPPPRAPGGPQGVGGSKRGGGGLSRTLPPVFCPNF